MQKPELSGDLQLKHSRSSGIQVRPVMVVQRLFTAVSTVAPGLKSWLHTSLVRMLYSGIGFIMRRDEFSFLNYGYVSLDSRPTDLELDAKDEADRLSIQLYARVAGARSLRDQDVLEIGCGRGGGASFMARYLHPRSVKGVDLAARAVRFCRQRHRAPGLTFLRGSAEHLPLESSSFDAVVNVESAHCYPSFEGFLDEVARVLRPNGHFLFADLCPRDDVNGMRERLKERFTLLDEEFITANVVRALEIDSDRRNHLIEKRAPRWLHKGLQTFAGVDGSPSFNAFSSGALQYVRFVAQKRP